MDESFGKRVPPDCSKPLPRNHRVEEIAFLRVSSSQFPNRFAKVPFTRRETLQLKTPLFILVSNSQPIFTPPEQSGRRNGEERTRQRLDRRNFHSISIFESARVTRSRKRSELKSSLPARRRPCTRSCFREGESPDGAC